MANIKAIFIFLCLWSLSGNAQQYSRSDLRILNLPISFNEQSESAELVFDVPENSRSFLLQFSSEIQSVVNFQKLIDPNSNYVMGEKKRDIKMLSLTQKLPEESNWENPLLIDSYGHVRALVPNNNVTKVVPGQWRVQLTCPDGCPNATGTLQVIIKQKKDPKAILTLPVRMHFSGYKEWRVKSLKSNDDFQTLLHAVNRFFEFHGIKLEILSQEDIPKQVFSSRNAANTAMRSYAQPDALNLFFIAGDENFQNLLGYSTGIPGTYLAPQGSSAFVAMKVQTFVSKNYDPNKMFGGDKMLTTNVPVQMWAQTLIHEVGHYLGLFHVCEAPIFDRPDGRIDPLADTKCDKVNLMYPSASIDKDTKLVNIRLTPQQLEILKNNPLIY